MLIEEDVQVAPVATEIRLASELAVVGPAISPKPAGLESAHLWERVGMVVAAAVLFWAAGNVEGAGQLPSHPVLILPTFALYAGALAALVYATISSPVRPRARQVIGWVILGLLLLGLVANSYVQITIQNPVYGTDAIALSQLAAERTLAGANPYTYQVSAGDLLRFDVPASSITETTFGRTIQNAVSYPALSFLEFVPPLVLGVKDLRWLILAFHVASILVIALSAPAQWRVLAAVPLVANSDLGLYFTSGGLTDWMWVLPTLLMVLSLYRGKTKTAALWLGLAAATKQQPWFLLPFLLVWIFHNYKRDRLALMAKMAAIAGAVFLLPNVPFILSDAGSWLRGVTAPLTEPMIPDGQGLSLLTQIGLLHVSNQFFTVAMLGVLAVSCIGYALYYDAAPAAAWVLPSLALWFSYRSFQSYFLYWLPILVLGLLLEHERRCRIHASFSSSPSPA